MCGIETYVGNVVTEHDVDQERVDINVASGRVRDAAFSGRHYFLGSMCLKTAFGQHEYDMRIPRRLVFRVDWGAGVLFDILAQRNRVVTFEGEVDGERRRTALNLPAGEFVMHDASSIVRPGVFYGIFGLSFPVRLGIGSKGQYNSLGLEFGGYY